MPPKNWRKTAPLYGCRQWWGRLFPWVKWLWRLAGLAWVIKIMLQGLTVIPEVGHFVFGFRPVIIAYLHLVMLVFVSLFMVGFFLQEKLLDDRPGLWKCGLVIFSSGVLLNEGFLLWDALPPFEGGFHASIGPVAAGDRMSYWTRAAVHGSIAEDH